MLACFDLCMDPLVSGLQTLHVSLHRKIPFIRYHSFARSSLALGDTVSNLIMYALVLYLARSVLSLYLRKTRSTIGHIDCSHETNGVRWRVQSQSNEQPILQTGRLASAHVTLPKHRTKIRSTWNDSIRSTVARARVYSRRCEDFAPTLDFWFSSIFLMCSFCQCLSVSLLSGSPEKSSLKHTRATLRSETTVRKWTDNERIALTDNTA